MKKLTEEISNKIWDYVWDNATNNDTDEDLCKEHTFYCKQYKKEEFDF